MPIYEFLCAACNRIFSFHSFKVAPDKVPACPKCRATDLRRVPSRFGVAAKKGSGEAAGGEGSEGDDPRMEREMMRFAAELENMDENDPRADGGRGAPDDRDRRRARHAGDGGDDPPPRGR
jgi:putative FmdB family regulatory protein